MFTKEVLDALGAMAVASTNPAMQNAEVGIPYVCLPSGVDVKSMENFLPAPTRFRGTFTTRRASDFAAYVATNHPKADEDAPPSRATRLFVDHERMQAIAYFGLGDHADPGWVDHSAILAPTKLPPYAALLANANARTSTGEKAIEHTQQQMLEFFRDWREDVEFFDEEGRTIGFGLAIEAIKSAKVIAKSELESTVGAHSGRVSALESNARQALSGVAMPDSFTFKCVPYDELPEFHFQCALRSEVKGAGIVFMYRIEALEARQLEIADAFIELIRDELDEVERSELGHDMRIGTFSRK